MDWEPMHGVQRPNHGLANAMRKAVLVEQVATAMADSTGGASFRFDPSTTATMQVAMLFEVCGRSTQHTPSDARAGWLSPTLQGCSLRTPWRAPERHGVAGRERLRCGCVSAS